jgi:hypothetical protein
MIGFKVCQQTVRLELPGECSYREVAPASGQERTIEDGESLGRGLEVSRHDGDLLDVGGDLGGGNGGSHGGKAGHDEGSETHIDSERRSGRYWRLWMLV